MWTRQVLRDLITERMKDYQFIVVANREPFIHRYNGEAVEAIRPASGMATAIDPIMDASGGTWIGRSLAGTIGEFARTGQWAPSRR